MTTKAVLLVNSLASGGAERIVATLISELTLQGSDVQLVCFEHEIFYKLPLDVKVTFLSSSTGNENSIYKLLLLPVLALKLKKFIKENHITLVQSHMYRANYVNVLSKLFGSTHSAQVVNCGQIGRYLKEGLLGKVNLFLIKHLYAKADCIILKAKGMQLDMNNIFQFEVPQQIVPNPCDIKKVHEMAQEPVVDFNFDCSKKYLISVGRFASFKRQEWIIESMKYLSSDVETIFIGDGPNRKKAMQKALQLGVSERTHFLGRRDNPFKYVAKADLFILSSADGEGLPNVLIESLACKIPVLSTDCVSGPREILAPSTEVSKRVQNEIEFAEFGVLVPVNNPQLIAKAVTELFSDNTMRETYRSLGENRAKDFDISKVTESYQQIMGLI